MKPICKSRAYPKNLDQQIHFSQGAQTFSFKVDKLQHAKFIQRQSPLLLSA
jgi:hypothetical protein